jgi:cob(I)alamin adenosyltransferase
MKKMAEKMKKSQMEMEGGGADQEDIGDLRSIIENLLHLSFEQEDVYNQVSKVNQLDPKYLTITQKQIKIKDDSQIIKDSLKALAKRAPQIESFIIKEMFAMDAAIEDAVTYVKARRPDIASAKGQMAMTNINNLTVMLKDALQQMQQQQQQQKQGGSKSCKKPGKGKPKPGGMSQMQKQLNEQISQLKNGKKPGQQMSQELAKMAQKQAAMRRALAEMEKSLQRGGKEKSGGLGDVKALMEKTERELLNKKLTPETIMRQQQILTRLLESEKALMEREQDQRREAEKPQSVERTTLPADLKELLRKAQSQKEQLLQGSPKLTEMYQDAYDKYFESIQERGL